MQIRYATNLSAEQFVQQQAWQAATLNQCPLHPQGGCGFCKNGTYRRKFPHGTQIARWYCPDGHMSFSLLPDCLASRLPGTLLEIEDVVAKVENSPSQEAAADVIRIDIELPGALRWMRRRIFLVKVALRILIELLPDLSYPSLTIQTEYEDAEVAGFDTVSLGPRVLRTETAGPAAVAVLQALHGDLR